MFLSCPQSLSVSRERAASCSSSEGVDEVQVGIQKSQGILQLRVVADVGIQHRHRGHGKHLPGGETERGSGTAIAADPAVPILGIKKAWSSST